MPIIRRNNSEPSKILASRSISCVESGFSCLLTLACSNYLANSLGQYSFIHFSTFLITLRSHGYYVISISHQKREHGLFHGENAIDISRLERSNPSNLLYSQMHNIYPISPPRPQDPALITATAELLSYVPRQAHLPPPEAVPPIVKISCRIVHFLIGSPPNDIFLSWRWKYHGRPDGYIPLIAMQLVDDFDPLSLAQGSEDSKAWAECFRFLADTFGLQYGFMFYIGKKGPEKWACPPRIWLRGGLSEKREHVVRYDPRLISPLAS